jgi:cytochrome c biogenesis protein CcdA/peroxiredoxin
VGAENVTLVIAFAAGFISFISPCVLPLVPAYIGYMGGRVTSTVAAQLAVSGGGQAVVGRTSGARFTTVVHSLSFVAGFTFVFVAIGLLSTALVQQVGGQNIRMVTDIIGRLGGVLIILFGLHFMGMLAKLFNYLQKDRRILGHRLFTPTLALLGVALILWGFTSTLLPPMTASIQTTASARTITLWPTIIALILSAVYLLWLGLGGALTRSEIFWSTLIRNIQLGLYTDTRHQMTARSGQGYSGSAIMGVIFSAGWTPCIGPVYGAVLTLAANTGDIGRAAPLLAAYSIGLGVPFVVTALLLDRAQGILRKLQRHMHKIELVSGAFLVLIGLLVASGTLQNLSQVFSSGQFAEMSINIENSVIGSLTGGNDESNAQPTAVPTAVESVGGLSSITDAAAGMTEPTSGTNMGDIAPNFQSVNDAGEPIQLSDFRGQVVVLNFWATWCGPCRVEMPEFEKAYQQNNADGFTILAINNQESVEDVLGFREEMGVSFPLIVDESGSIQDQYGVRSYPSTIILNREGLIIGQHFGPLTAEQIEELVRQAVA